MAHVADAAAQLIFAELPMVAVVVTVMTETVPDTLTATVPETPALMPMALTASLLVAMTATPRKPTRSATLAVCGVVCSGLAAGRVPDRDDAVGAYRWRRPRSGRWRCRRRARSWVVARLIRWAPKAPGARTIA